MAAINMFELLGEDDTGDLESLLARTAAKQRALAAKQQEEASALADKREASALADKRVSQAPPQTEASCRSRGSGGRGRGRGRIYYHQGPHAYGNVVPNSNYREESFVRGRGGRYYDGENRSGYYKDGERRWVEHYGKAQVADSTDNKESTVDNIDQANNVGAAEEVDPAGNSEQDQLFESGKLQTVPEEGNSKGEKADNENEKKGKKKNKSKDFTESAYEKQKPRQENYANRMTLEEYENVLRESRKTLETMKSKERTVDPDQYIGLKIVGKSKKQLEEVFESVQPKRSYEENKEKAKGEKRVSAPKVISINEFLKGYKDSRGRAQTRFNHSEMNGSGYWRQHNSGPENSRLVDSAGHVAPNGARYMGSYSNWNGPDSRYQGHNSDHVVVGHNGDKSTGHDGDRRGYNRERQYHDYVTYNENIPNATYNGRMHNNGSRFNGVRPINNGANYNRGGHVNNGASYNGDRRGRSDAYYSGEKNNDYFVEDERKVLTTSIVQVDPPPSIEDPKEFPTLPGVP